MNRHRRDAVLTLAAILPFVAGIRSEFLPDDRFLIFDRLNPEVVRTVADFFTTDYWSGVVQSGLYRPIGLLFLYAQRLIFGTSVEGYHVVSLLLHLVACLLLLRLLQSVLSENVAFGAALLFTVHPIHAEAVLPVYGQLDLLAAIFVILYLLTDRAEKRLAAIVALTLACLTKESALIAPLLLVLMRAISDRASNSRAYLLDITYWVVPVTVLLLRHTILGSFVLRPEATVVGNGGTVLWIKSIVISVGQAVRLCILPTGQTVYYGHLRDELAGLPFESAAWLIAFGVLIWALFAFIPTAGGILGVGWFCISLLPVSNIVPIGVLVAERSLYLPSAGIAILAGLAWRMLPGSDRARLLVGIAILLGATAASAKTAWDWRTDLSLWRTTVRDHPTSPKARAMFGLALLGELLGESKKDRSNRAAILQEAGDQFDDALARNPGSVEGLYGKGLWFVRQDNCPAAIPYLERAVSARPEDKAMRQDLAMCVAVSPPR